MMIKFFNIVIVSMFFLCGCSDNEDVVNYSDNGQQLVINSNRLVGKWYLKGGTINGGAFQNYVNDCPSSRDYQYFNSNGKLDFFGFDATCNTNGPETSNWKLTGSILTVTSLPGASVLHNYVYNIESITQQELVLKFEYNDGNGQVVEMSYFTKN